MNPRMMFTGVSAFLLASSLAVRQEKGKANSLLKEAKISRHSAGKVALARVPSGRITESELEREDGTLVWSFDLKIRGRSGVEEVQVDAITGALVKQEYESPESEVREKAAEKARKKR